jgi:dienelactone hydrolase
VIALLLAQALGAAEPTVEVEAKGLDGATALSIGAWVFPTRRGEQHFLRRGELETGPGGEACFRPAADRVTFLLGTDARGFLRGAVHGNGSLPFPFVTLDEPPLRAWSRLVAVKDAKGYTRYYRNGVLVAGDVDAAAGGVVRPFRDAGPDEPARLAVPPGGRSAEPFVLPREMTAEEVREDFDRDRRDAVPPEPVALRTMDAKPGPGLWKEPVTVDSWPLHRERILKGVREIFGPMPAERVPLDPRLHGEEDLGAYVRRKVSIQVQAGDRMPAWLLVPKSLRGRVPAVLCVYGTTSGAGKDTTVGLSGPKPGTPPAKNRAFAIDLVEAGFVAFAPDLLRDGERVAPGRRPYDTTDFYAKHPEWSIHGKDAWDLMRAVDWLQSLPEVDPERIGMVGHSYGGHTTIFTAAFEPRIKACWANGPVSDFVGHGMHWAVPKGGSSSQSLPALRPYLLEKRAPPIAFYEVTSLIAPRALAVGQAVGERRPMEEENHAAVGEVYRALGAGDAVRYLWYPGDHDFPPPARREMVAWFRRQLTF